MKFILPVLLVQFLFLNHTDAQDMNLPAFHSESYLQSMELIYSFSPFMNSDSIIEERNHISDLYLLWYTYLLEPNNHDAEIRLMSHAVNSTMNIKNNSLELIDFYFVFCKQIEIRILNIKKDHLKALQSLITLSRTMNEFNDTIFNLENSAYYFFIQNLRSYFISYTKEKFSLINKKLSTQAKTNSLMNLQNCTLHPNIVINVESRYFLAKIYTELEESPNIAFKYILSLSNEFPENVFFRTEKLKAMIASQQNITEINIEYKKIKQLIMNLNLTEPQKMHQLEVIDQLYSTIH